MYFSAYLSGGYLCEKNPLICIFGLLKVGATYVKNFEDKKTTNIYLPIFFQNSKIYL